MEKAMTIEQVAGRYGYKTSFVREACARDNEHHPLPHIERGASRPVCYIQPSTFERWLAEEERLTVGLIPDNVAADNLHSFMRSLIEMYESCEQA